LLAEPDEEGREMTAQTAALFLMTAVGVVSLAWLTDDWRTTPTRQRIAIATWLAFWLGPPLYFIWTKGVMG
jgi:hypothetical protein